MSKTTEQKAIDFVIKFERSKNRKPENVSKKKMWL